jgi:23S rRNA U2552 (ribose-2'-O)-methylase RlmE/FtsJ
LMAALKRDFARVRTAKPPASRPESGETYIGVIAVFPRP